MDQDQGFREAVFQEVVLGGSGLPLCELGLALRLGLRAFLLMLESDSLLTFDLLGSSMTHFRSFMRTEGFKQMVPHEPFAESAVHLQLTGLRHGVRLSVRWSAGLLVCWSNGPLVRWSDGPLVCWSTGPLVHWSLEDLSVCVGQQRKRKRRKRCELPSSVKELLCSCC